MANVKNAKKKINLLAANNSKKKINIHKNKNDIKIKIHFKHKTEETTSDNLSSSFLANATFRTAEISRPKLTNIEK